MNHIKSLAVALILGLLSSCSYKAGHFEPETHFSFPNSNVTPLNQVKASLSRWSFLMPSIQGNDALSLMQQAIAQQVGADLVINYVLDTKITVIPPFFYKTDMVFEGTAAKMIIGEQNLRSILEQVQYKPFKEPLK